MGCASVQHQSNCILWSVRRQRKSVKFTGSHLLVEIGAESIRRSHSKSKQMWAIFKTQYNFLSFKGVKKVKIKKTLHNTQFWPINKVIYLFYFLYLYQCIKRKKNIFGIKIKHTKLHSFLVQITVAKIPVVMFDGEKVSILQASALSEVN